MPILQDRILTILTAAEFYQEFSRVLVRGLREAFQAQIEGQPSQAVADKALDALYSVEPMLINAESHIMTIATERQHYKHTHKHNSYMRNYQRQRRNPDQQQVTTKPSTPKSASAIAAAIARGEISTNGKRYEPLDTAALAEIDRLLATGPVKDAAEAAPTAGDFDVLDIGAEDESK